MGTVKLMYDMYIHNVCLLHDCVTFNSVSNLHLSSDVKWIGTNNVYLDANSNAMLARDILANGMLLHFFIDSTMSVTEGQHRLVALKTIECPTEYMCLNFDALIEIPILSFPVTLVWNLFSTDRLRMDLKTERILISKRDPKFCALKCHDSFEVKNFMLNFGIEVSKIIYKHKLEDHVQLSGSKFICNEQAFRESLKYL